MTAVRLSNDRENWRRASRDEDTREYQRPDTKRGSAARKNDSQDYRNKKQNLDALLDVKHIVVDIRERYVIL